MYLRANKWPKGSSLFNICLFTYVCLHFPQSDNEVLNSLEELSMSLGVNINSFTEVLEPQGGERVYIYIYIYIIAWYVYIYKQYILYIYKFILCIYIINTDILTKKLWYNKKVCLWMTIYICMYVYNV